MQAGNDVVLRNSFGVVQVVDLHAESAWRAVKMRERSGDVLVGDGLHEYRAVRRRR